MKMILLEPVFKQMIWGGNRMRSEYGYDIPGDNTGECWAISAHPQGDCTVANGQYAGMTLSQLWDSHRELFGNAEGDSFPLLTKIIDAQDDLSIQVHPDDEIAAERYDSLGKAEIWYVMDAKPGAKMYCGFTREVSAQEFYDRCKNGTVDEILNVIYPKKGDVIYITPGTVHAADGGLLIAEIQESSDMTFRLYDWGREFNPATARQTHLEEAIDIIDYRPFDFGLYRKGPLWGDEASNSPCKAHECHCHDDECHCNDHEHECHCHDHKDEGGIVETLVESPQFNVTKLHLSDPLHIYTEKFESFIVYICLEGAASVQVPSTRENGEAYMENYEFSKGETILIPADMPDFYLVPRDRSTILLEAVTRPVEEQDEYIDPTTEAFLENEDYEGLEDGAFDDDEPSKGPAGASPLNFFS